MLKALMAGLLAIVVLSNSALASTIPHKAILQAENLSVYITADISKMTYGDNINEADAVKEIKDRAICSGSILASRGTEEIILTARHCTEGDETLYGRTDVTPRTVHFFNGDIGKVEAVKRDPKLDVARLLVHSMRAHKEHDELYSKVTPGESLFLYGMPDGYFWSFSDMTSMNGTMENNIRLSMTDAFDFMQLSCAACYGGNSGGAVFNAKGQVVGIMNAKGPNSMWMTSASRIKNMIHNM